jgi:caffeoyl-CoA O-methyltransferase
VSGTSPEPTPEELERYAADHTTTASPVLDAVARSTIRWSGPASEMMIDATEGQLLKLLAGVVGARRILEIGTFGGYSALAMAEALPADGGIDTLELDPAHAAKAAEHVESAGQAGRVNIHVGEALETLDRLEGPYDMAFIDAGKAEYPDYYDRVVPLMRPGGLIVADNVLRHGRILEADSSDPSITGMRTFNERAATDPRVDTVMLTMRDGVSLIRVRD